MHLQYHGDLEGLLLEKMTGGRLFNLSLIILFWLILYKMKIWRRIYFGGLVNYENLPN